MPSLVRLKARIVTLMFIALSSLRSTIAHPIELGEGESFRETGDLSHPTVQQSSEADSYSSQYSSGYFPNYAGQFQGTPNSFSFAIPFQQMTNFDGSNVQINYQDEHNQQSFNDNIPKSGQQDDATQYNENLKRRFSNNDLNKMQKNVNNLSGAIGASKSFSNDFSRQEIQQQGLIQTPSKARDSIQLVTPKYVANFVLAPIKFLKVNDWDNKKADSSSYQFQHSPRESAVVGRFQHDPKEAAVIGHQTDSSFASGKQFGEEEIFHQSNDEDQVPPPWDIENKHERVDVPTQDVGEEEDSTKSDDEDLSAEGSNNIAYSYSHFVPNFQPAPARYSENNNFGNNDVAPMSFIFHPSILSGSQPELVLQELKAFALQLAQSPFMNALFSPSTVPIPSSPAWPSRYEAQKYLPPHEPISQPYLAPHLRRALIQVNSESLSPEMLEQLQTDDRAPSKFVANAVQEYLGTNVASFDEFMKKKMQFPEQQAIQAFDSTSQGFIQGSQAFDRGAQAFDTSSAALSNFFNNQLQLPKFPNFPTFSTQIQYQGYLAPRVRGIIPNLPQLQKLPVPYISPSLRNVDLDPTDDIDVRMDTRSDSAKGNGMRSKSGMQIIQIGNGNKNVYDVEQFTNDEDSENEDESVDNPNVVTEAGEKLNEQANDESAIKNPEVAVFGKERSDFEVHEMTTTRDGFADPSTLDVVASDAEEGGLGEQVREELKANQGTSNLVLPVMNQIRQNAIETIKKVQDCGTLGLTNQKADDEVEKVTTLNEEFTTQLNMSDEMTTTEYVTTDSLNDEETTTDPSMTEDSFNLDERLDVNVIRSLAG